MSQMRNGHDARIEHQLSVNKMLTNIKRIKNTGCEYAINLLRKNGDRRVIIRCLFHHFVYPTGKPMIPHLLCYQGLAVDDYGFALDAADMEYPRPSLI